MKTFPVTICRHDVGHVPVALPLRQDRATDTAKPLKATNEELCLPSIRHNDRRKLRESECRRKMQFQL